MPVIGILVFLIQLGFAVHVVRTGRDQFWIYVVIFIPGIGCLLYFLTQVVPDLGQNRTVRNTKKSLLNAVDPQRELRKRRDELAISDSIANRTRLAEECVEAKLYDDAIELYQSCLRGLHQNDPDMMLALANAYFLAGQANECKQTLEQLIEKNPNFKSPQGHLLYARSLELMEDYPAALKEYQAVAATFPGEEARAHYAMLLTKLERRNEAIDVFEEILLRARRSPKFYRKKEAQWIALAKANA